MRKISFVVGFVLTLSILVFQSCSKNDPAPDPELTVSTEQLTIAKEGETKSFHIKSNVPWTISSSQAWCTVSPLSGGAGTLKIDVTASENETTVDRSANLTVTAGSLSSNVTVTQSASVLLTVSEDEFTVDAEGEDITLQVQSSGDYDVEILGEWITAVDGSPSGSPVFRVEQNRGLFEREGTITFSLGDITQFVTIDQLGNALTIPADNSGMGSDAMALAQQMTVGWNLGNSLEATSVNNGVFTASETLWGNAKTTKTLIDGVKAAGFNAVRIPCAWSGYIDDVETHRLKDSWLVRVKEVIDYCVDNDMFVIINIHWDGGWLENNPTYAKQAEVNVKQKALWEQIAVYFRDYDEHLLFAGTNEVHFDYNNPTSEHIEVQLTYNQTFVDAVRSTGGRNAWRNLVVQAYNTNIAHAKNYLEMPSDASGVTNRLMAEVHYYDPYEFTIDNTSSIYLWGEDFAGSPNTATWGQEDWLDDAFATMKTSFVDNGIPVILGEYAPTFRTSLPAAAFANHVKARNDYLNYVNKAAKANGLVPFYWDNGHTGEYGSGLFNRATGEVVYGDAVNAITSAHE